MTDTQHILKVENLCQFFKTPSGILRAVDDISFTVKKGEVFGIVGESGCGKTTTGRSIIGLVKPDGGEIIYNGQDLTKLNDKEFRPLRKEIQLVFQDSLSSLSPRHRIGDILEEPLIIQGIGTKEERREQVLEVLHKVGLPEEHYFRKNIISVIHMNYPVVRYSVLVSPEH